MEREMANCQLPIANCKLRRKRHNPTEGGFRRRPQFAICNRYPRPGRGFTLVELLVVITIIGILMTLIIPGVNSLREQGRQTTCLNNQMQLAKAMLAYEVAKSHIPGVLNQTSGGVTYSWVEALFPYLDRADMWEAVSANNVAQIQTMNLRITICPNDPYSVDPTSANAQALLSYGVNDGFFLNYVNNPPTDRNGAVQAPAVLSKLTTRPTTSYPRGQSVSSSVTIMIGERTGDASVPQATTPYYQPTAGNYPYVAGHWTCQVWNTSTSLPAFPPAPPPPPSSSYLTFHWPPATAPMAISPTPILPGIMVSSHPGKVIAAFFDGHGEKINNDAVYPQ